VALMVHVQTSTKGKLVLRSLSSHHGLLYNAVGLYRECSRLTQNKTSMWGAMPVRSPQHMNFCEDWEMVSTLKLPALDTLLSSASVPDAELSRLPQNVVDS